MFKAKQPEPPDPPRARRRTLDKAADPRLELAFELTEEYRKVMLAALGSLRDRSLSIFQIVILGSSIILAFGASARGHLHVWAVILLLIGLAYCGAATAWIMWPGRWNAGPLWKPLVDAVDAKCKHEGCDCADTTIDDCLRNFLDNTGDEFKENQTLLDRKRVAFQSEFVILGLLIVLAVMFWATLGA